MNNQQKKHHHLIKPIAEGIFVFVLFTLSITQLFFLSEKFIKLDNLAAVLPSVLVMITNEERSDKNIQPLVENELLVKAAELKANDMALKGYFAHTSPDGVTPWTWLNIAGYKYEKAGENLAVNFIDSVDVVESWMNSPSHRDNILSNKYTEVGIATSVGQYKGREGVFVVQYFGTPTSLVATNEPEVKIVIPEVVPIVEESVAPSITKIEEVEINTQEIQQEFIADIAPTEVLGEKTQQTELSVSNTNIIESSQKTLAILILYGLLLIVLIKLALGLHFRHTRTIVLSLILVVLIAIFISIDSQMFIGFIN